MFEVESSLSSTGRPTRQAGIRFAFRELLRRKLHVDGADWINRATDSAVLSHAAPTNEVCYYARGIGRIPNF